MMKEGIDVTGIPGPNPMLGYSSWHYTHCIMFKSRKSW